ncbi:glycosyltransferase family 4 protein [Micromonospora thermarum]|uniref:Glycosyltransferase family 4 protein n=1 Tax=Micromonospora thermarum TaxID=2720024 RepID=A0ABX0Z1C7_9ACTN|nr:glycosyltransferase family 1 protein [Micromonospora thermarum]NJP30809.1 glycosyltransferase family 4 protein [Micromonospora thermarum]
MIAIDTRWIGAHGIGRYAAEVIGRLRVEWEALDAKGNPASPIGVLKRPTTRSGKGIGLLYSPGYMGFRGVTQQIVTVHDLIHLQTRWPQRARYLAYYEQFLKPLIRRNGIVLTVSETSRDAIREWIGDPDVDIVNTGNGLSEAFTVDGPASAEGKPYFLYVGNLKGHKNVEVVLRALAFIDDFSMVMVCGDSDGARELTARLGVADRVTHVSGVDDATLAQLYRGASATVVPSLIEGFGLPALESLACGTQVVYWKGCPSVAEICGPHGISVSGADDAQEWAFAMTNAAGLPAPNYDSSPYSWPAVAARVNDVLEGRQA